jgi:uncharacterized protein YndB with AHSA1/START domain
MTTAVEFVERIAGRAFVMTRDFDAPRSLVFKAWTDPALLIRWWGPRDFINPVVDLDLRPGGDWLIIMRSPEGVDYPLKGVYREIVEPERIVMTEDWEEHPPEWQEKLRRRDAEGGEPEHEALDIVTFEEYEEGRTALTIRTLFETTATRDAMVKTGMEEGWSQSLDKLEELLATL